MTFEDLNCIEPFQVRIHFCMPAVPTVTDFRFLNPLALELFFLILAHPVYKM